MTQANIWLIGLAVMWENLARNIANNGFKISVYNRTWEKTKTFIWNNYSPNLEWTYSIQDFVSSLETPRKIIIMVKAWKPVDGVISELLPFLDAWDIIIDCGNSYYKDSQRRFHMLQEKNIEFIWCWVSGGEEGALHGPSIMPGWTLKAYSHVQEILEKISAWDFHNQKCVSYIGENGSGHYVKMVHNGIEYAIMQMMAEWYDILRKHYHLSAPEIAKIFAWYHNGKLNSYLFEISEKILQKQDEFNSEKYLIDEILDIAWAKGTWLWTSTEWLEKQSPIWAIIEATQARSLSGKKQLRNKLSNIYQLSSHTPNISLEDFIVFLWDALYSGMLLSYAQWLQLIKDASTEENWNVNMAEITRIWQWWCIIRAKILDFLTQTYTKQPNVENILELPEIKDELLNSLWNYQKTLEIALWAHIATPSLSSALQYFYGITQSHGSANFIQGLRDYFWAHTYQRKDRDGIFHTEWN